MPVTWSFPTMGMVVRRLSDCCSGRLDHESYTGPLRDSILIDLYDVYFSPPELEIPANQPVAVTVTNHGDKPHTFTVERWISH